LLELSETHLWELRKEVGSLASFWLFQCFGRKTQEEGLPYVVGLDKRVTCYGRAKLTGSFRSVVVVGGFVVDPLQFEKLNY
jgi:hypothetical protein